MAQQSASACLSAAKPDPTWWLAQLSGRSDALQLQSANDVCWNSVRTSAMRRDNNWPDNSCNNNFDPEQTKSPIKVGLENGATPFKKS